MRLIEFARFCTFIQHLLQRFDPASHATLEWSNDCSKPRMDAFGGGAAIITAKKIKSMSTGEGHTAVDGLKAERQVLAMMEHPNIVLHVMEPVSPPSVTAERAKNRRLQIIAMNS
jgi:hypothetical protein